MQTAKKHRQGDSDVIELSMFTIGTAMLQVYIVQCRRDKIAALVNTKINQKHMQSFIKHDAKLMTIISIPKT